MPPALVGTEAGAVSPAAIKTRTDDEWIIVSSVSEVMGERDHGS
jgi:hypothetical protein